MNTKKTYSEVTNDMDIAISAAEPRKDENPEHYAEVVQKLNKTFKRMVNSEALETALISGANQFLQSLRDKDKDLSLDEMKAMNEKIKEASDLLNF